MKLFKSDEFGHFMPTEGIIFKGQVVECWLPDHCGPYIPYDPRKLPAIVYDATLRPMGIAIWRCYDGIEGDRFTKEKVWWSEKYNSQLS